MKRTLVAFILAAAAATVSAQQLNDAGYRLRAVIPVEGRQGIAVDSNYYYVSDTRALLKYTKQGELVQANRAPFNDPARVNHLGDIDVYNGELYCGVERFEYGRGYDIAVAVYDAATLEWKRDLPWSPWSGQVEVSGIAVDRDGGKVWMSDWVDSRYVYCYDLATGRYHTRMQLAPTPWWCQGLFVARGGRMILSADDGDAAFNIPDNLYAVTLGEVPYTGLKEGVEVERESPFAVKLDDGGRPVMRRGLVPAGTQAGRVEHLRCMHDFKRAGEIEGLAIDPVNNELVVLNNRGTSIVLGMSQGPLVDEGYDRELHELYIYEPI